MVGRTLGAILVLAARLCAGRRGGSAPALARILQAASRAGESSPMRGPDAQCDACTAWKAHSATSGRGFLEVDKRWPVLLLAGRGFISVIPYSFWRHGTCHGAALGAEPPSGSMRLLERLLSFLAIGAHQAHCKWVGSPG